MRASVVETNLNLIIIEAVHVFAHLDIGNEIIGISKRNSITLRKFLEFLLLAFVTDGLVTDLNLEDITIDKVATERKRPKLGYGQIWLR